MIIIIIDRKKNTEHYLHTKILLLKKKYIYTIIYKNNSIKLFSMNLKNKMMNTFGKIKWNKNNNINDDFNE